MNVFTRLFFVLLGFIGLYIFANGFMSSENLSVGQGLMLGSIVPASLFLFATACHTKEHANEVVSVMGMLIGIFFTMLSYGMYKLTGELPYGIFAWLGIMLCGTSVAMVMMVPTQPQRA